MRNSVEKTKLLELVFAFSPSSSPASDGQGGWFSPWESPAGGATTLSKKKKKNPWSYTSVCDGSQHHGSNRFNLGLRIGLLASNWKSCYLFIILFDFIYFSIRDCWVKYTAKKQPGRALGGVI